MPSLVLACLLCTLSLGGCGGPLVMERVEVENGMVVGEERLDVDDAGRVVSDNQQGYLPNNPYLKAYEYGDDLGPNAPGYIP